MLAHHGYRAVWPVMLFAPWITLGFAYLVQSVRERLVNGSQVMH